MRANDYVTTNYVESVKKSYTKKEEIGVVCVQFYRTILWFDFEKKERLTFSPKTRIEY